MGKTLPFRHAGGRSRRRRDAPCIETGFVGRRLGVASRRSWHILSGTLDVPSTGSFRLAGEDVATLDEDRLAELRNRHIGFADSSTSSRTCRRGATSSCRSCTAGPAHRTSRPECALGDRSELPRPRGPSSPGELLGGRHRSGCANLPRAVVDRVRRCPRRSEPTGNLDSDSTGRRARDCAHGEGRTIVIITHDPYRRPRPAHRDDARRGDRGNCWTSGSVAGSVTRAMSGADT